MLHIGSCICETNSTTKSKLYIIIIIITSIYYIYICIFNYLLCVLNNEFYIITFEDVSSIIWEYQKYSFIALLNST